MGINASRQKVHSELISTRKTYPASNSSDIRVNSDQILQQENHIKTLQESWIRKDLQPGEPSDRYEIYQRGIILKKELEKLYYLKTNTFRKLKLLDIWYQ